MLVLSRKVSEGVEIGSDVKVSVVSISSTGTVKLGIEAPASVPIYRGEMGDVARRDIDERAGILGDERSDDGNASPNGPTDRAG